jgi:hypothetical protein
MKDKHIVCVNCGIEYRIGEWPFCPHGFPVEHRPFVPYFDEHIVEGGAWITSHRDRVRLNKQNNQDFAGRPVGMPGCEV